MIMTVDGMPYFMTNDEWYYVDDDKGIMVLTEKGKKIPEVVKSYKEWDNYNFYSHLTEMEKEFAEENKQNANATKNKDNNKNKGKK